MNKKIIHLVLGDVKGGLDIISNKIFHGINKTYQQKIYYLKDGGEIIYDGLDCEKLNSILYKNQYLFVNFLSKLKILKKTDIIHIHNAKFWVLFSPLFFFKKKTIFSFHSNFGSNIKKNILQKILIRLLMTYFALFSKKLIFLTKAQKDLLCKYSFFKKHFLKKSVVIPNFIKDENILSEKKIYNNNTIFVGRYTKLKGFHDLECVMKDLRKMNFHLIGSNDYHSNKNIINYGIIKNNKILNYYDKSSIFILPSYTEVFPMTVLEAMSRGLVILVSDIPGMKEIIKAGKNGYLFEPGDTNKIKQKLLYLKNNPNEIKRISKNNLKDIRNYTAKKQIKKYIDVYEDILND